uniref:ATP-binding protein n=1 Tax=Heterorhabditis bacteriophora TaxID=37862 RepID=A0A1I7WHP1_HETBA
MSKEISRIEATLHGLDLTLPKNKTLLITGGSGVGKSSLLRVCLNTEIKYQFIIHFLELKFVINVNYAIETN